MQKLNRSLSHRQQRTAIGFQVERLEGRLLLSATWTVSSTADDGSAGTLRYAIEQSSTGDDIQFASPLLSPPNQTQINLGSAPVEISHDLSIIGPGLQQLSLSGSVYGLFEIDAGAHVAVSGVQMGGGGYSGEGGAAQIAPGAALDLSNCTISNSHTARGAGIFNAGALSADNCTFGSNFASDSGGAIYNAGAMSVTNCDFLYNDTSNAPSIGTGGAIENAASGSAIIGGSFFSENASARGGAIDNSGQMWISACAFAYNDSVFSNPIPATYGGGAIHSDGSLNIVNSTLNWNRAGGEVGGGIDAAGPTTLTNCTIADNMAPNGSGINAENGAAVTLNNTIVAGNMYSTNGGSSSTFIDITGSVSGAYNLIGTGGSGGLANGTDGNRVGVMNPGLAPLLNNGGPTPTMALEADSPAFDAGSTALAVDAQGWPLSADQRGQPRVFGKSADIGAYEAQPPAPPAQPVATAGADEVSVSWMPAADAATYSVYRGTVSDGQSAIAIASGITAHGFLDTSAPAGTTYYYKVTAVNAAGQSAPSQEVSARPFLPVINGTAGNDSIRLQLGADRRHIVWTMGSESGQVLISDPNGLTIHGNGGTDTIELPDPYSTSFPDVTNFNGTFNIVGRVLYAPRSGQVWNINRSTLFLHYNSPRGDPIASVEQDLAAGYDGDRWDGSASPLSSGVITSAAAAGNRLRNTAIGYADSADGLIPSLPADTVELKYTVAGDANLDGIVNLPDLLIFAAHFGQTRGWDAGDFNYDQSIDLLDLLTLARHWGQSLPTEALLPLPGDPRRALSRRV